MWGGGGEQQLYVGGSQLWICGNMHAAPSTYARVAESVSRNKGSVSQQSSGVVVYEGCTVVWRYTRVAQ